MKYAFLVTEPSMLPYVLPIKMDSIDELQEKAVEVYKSKSLICPIMLIDFDNKKVWRVSLREGNYSLSDSAEDLYGVKTKVDQIQPR